MQGGDDVTGIHFSIAPTRHEIVKSAYRMRPNLAERLHGGRANLKPVVSRGLPQGIDCTSGGRSSSGQRHHRVVPHRFRLAGLHLAEELETRPRRAICLGGRVGFRQGGQNHRRAGDTQERVTFGHSRAFGVA
jgi:hypothetical protein